MRHQPAKEAGGVWLGIRVCLSALEHLPTKNYNLIEPSFDQHPLFIKYFGLRKAVYSDACCEHVTVSARESANQSKKWSQSKTSKFTSFQRFLIRANALTDSSAYSHTKRVRTSINYAWYIWVCFMSFGIFTASFSEVILRIDCLYTVYQNTCV